VVNQVVAIGFAKFFKVIFRLEPLPCAVSAEPGAGKEYADARIAKRIAFRQYPLIFYKFACVTRFKVFGGDIINAAADFAWYFYTRAVFGMK
jgi:hypothetical protein